MPGRRGTSLVTNQGTDLEVRIMKKNLSGVRFLNCSMGQLVEERSSFLAADLGDVGEQLVEEGSSSVGCSGICTQTWFLTEVVALRAKLKSGLVDCCVGGCSDFGLSGGLSCWGRDDCSQWGLKVGLSPVLLRLTNGFTLGKQKIYILNHSVSLRTEAFIPCMLLCHVATVL